MGCSGNQLLSCFWRLFQASAVPTAPTSGCCIQRRSNTGRSERIGGSHLKLCSGGGEEVAHSNVYACHGSAPALRGPRSDFTMLITNGTNDTNRTRYPMDEITLYNSKESNGE